MLNNNYLFTAGVNSRGKPRTVKDYDSWNYVIGETHAVKVTEDKASTWTKYDISNSVVNKVAARPSGSGGHMIATSTNVYMIVDGQVVKTVGLPDANYRLMSQYSLGQDYDLYVSDGSKLYRRKTSVADADANAVNMWDEITYPASTYMYSIDAVDNYVMMVGNKAVHLSLDAGDTWTDVTSWHSHLGRDTLSSCRLVKLSTGQVVAVIASTAGCYYYIKLYSNGTKTLYHKFISNRWVDISVGEAHITTASVNGSSSALYKSAEIVSLSSIQLTRLTSTTGYEFKAFQITSSGACSIYISNGNIAYQNINGTKTRHTAADVWTCVSVPNTRMLKTYTVYE